MWKYYDFSLVNNRYEIIDYHILTFVSASILFFAGNTFKRYGGLVWPLLMTFFVISIMAKKDDSMFVQNLLMCLSLFLLFYLKKRLYNYFVIAACIVIVPFIIMYLNNIIFGGMSPGNRGSLHITVCGLLLISAAYPLYYRRNKIFLAFYSFLIVSGALFASRTCVITILISLLLYVYFYEKELAFSKRHTNKLKYAMAALVIIMLFYNTIVDFLFNKWGSNTQHSFVSTVTESTREVMWEDISNTFTLWGFKSDYMLTQFGYGNAHNGFIQTYVSFGIICAIGYVIWCLFVLHKSIRRWKSKDMQGLILFFIPMLFFTMFESACIMDYVYPFIGLSVVIVGGQICRVDKEQLKSYK